MACVALCYSAAGLCHEGAWSTHAVPSVVTGQGPISGRWVQPRTPCMPVNGSSPPLFQASNAVLSRPVFAIDY